MYIFEFSTKFPNKLYTINYLDYLSSITLATVVSFVAEVLRGIGSTR